MEKKVVKKKIVTKATPKKAVAKPRAPKAEKIAKKSVGELSAPLFTSLGKSAGTVSLPASIFGTSWNSDLVHQVTLGMQANARAGNGRAHTKGRGEVRGGGKKPWKQKGTGRARHGSIRSPIWRGGGTTHGPTASKEYGVRIPKKMKTAALFSVLSRKLKDGQLLFVDELSFAAPKTRDAMAVIGGLSKISGFEKLAKKTGNTALFVMPSNDEMVKKSFQNIGTTDVEEARNLNALDALSYTYVVVVNPENAVKVFESKMN
jgi:large subunit ribosomal protein L4